MHDNSLNKRVGKRASVKDTVYELMHTPLSQQKIADLKSRGIDLEPHHYTMFLLMVMGQVEGATKLNNTKAFENLIGIMEESETENVKLNYELPARVMGKSFVDVNRVINNREYSRFLFKGGRGSLKSTYVAEKFIELIKTNPNTHALVTRPVANTLRDSVLAQFSWAISTLNDDVNWKKTTNPMQLTYIPTGQIIFFRGGDEPEKIKSIKPPFGHIAYLWFEEVDQFRGEEQIRNIKQSAIRGGDEGLIFKSYNTPRSRAHWINKFSKTHQPNMYVHHSNYLDVPPEWLGQFFLEEAELLKETNEDAYLHEYMGEEVGDGGNVFGNVVAREFTKAEIDNFDYVYHGQDWGWFPDPNRFVAMGYDANARILRIYREEDGVRVPNEVWQHRIEDIKRFTITADSNEMKSIDDFKSWGFDMRAAEKGPGSVHEGMKWLAGLTRIEIDPKACPKTFAEFMRYEYVRDKNGDPVTDYPDKDNHSIAAVRYAMEVVWKRRGL